jgi:hypothetical protein
MNSLALLDKALLLATHTEAKWGKRVTHGDDNKFLSGKLPSGCTGYAYTLPKDRGTLDKILDLCRNDKGQKMLCSYVVKSNDLRWPSRIVIYMTETMAQKWSEDTPLPSALVCLLKSFVKDDEEPAEMPADDEPAEVETPAEEKPKKQRKK